MPSRRSEANCTLGASPGSVVSAGCSVTAGVASGSSGRPPGFSEADGSALSVPAGAAVGIVISGGRSQRE